MQILETGCGYTLSGKLLNPYCASARAYGLKPPVVERELTENPHACKMLNLLHQIHYVDGHCSSKVLSLTYCLQHVYASGKNLPVQMTFVRLSIALRRFKMLRRNWPASAIRLMGRE